MIIVSSIFAASALAVAPPDVADTDAPAPNRPASITAVMAGGDAPGTVASPLQAAWDLYIEESLDPQGAEVRDQRAFYREWHDRLATLAAEAPAQPAKVRVLRGVTTLAVALGDVPAAIDAAAKMVAAADDPVTKADALLYEARVGLTSVRRGADDVRREQVVAMHRRALEAYAALPEEDRGPLQIWAVQGASQSAGVWARTGHPADAVEMLDAALRLRVGLPEIDEYGDDEFSAVSFLKRRAAAEAAAGRPEAAAATLAEFAGESGVPPVLLAFETAKAADLGGAGGDFMEARLAAYPGDEYAGRIKAALASRYDFVGRDDDALRLLLEIREGADPALIMMQPAEGRHAPYANVLFRLWEMLKERGDAETAAEVAGEFLRRYPNEGRRLIVQGVVRVKVTTVPKPADGAKMSAEDSERQD